MQQVYLSLGSNLNTPEEQLIRAIQALSQIAQTQLVAYSSFYSTTPVGPQDQPRFVNVAVELATELSPLELLDATQKIELEQGRVRKEQRWGPRTLDIDILLFGEQIINHQRLTVPHYQMHVRAFMLEPLAEICPTEFKLPNAQTLAQLRAQCPPDKDLKALYKPDIATL